MEEIEHRLGKYTSWTLLDVDPSLIRLFEPLSPTLDVDESNLMGLVP